MTWRARKYVIDMGSPSFEDIQFGGGPWMPEGDLREPLWETGTNQWLGIADFATVWGFAIDDMTIEAKTYMQDGLESDVHTCKTKFIRTSVDRMYMTFVIETDLPAFRWRIEVEP